MSQTTIIVCVVLFLFLFFVLCTQKSENYDYGIDPSKNSGLTELLQNKTKFCIDKEQRRLWHKTYRTCQLANMYQGGEITYCCIPPPPSCDSLSEDMRDDYIKLDSDDVQSKLNYCGNQFKNYFNTEESR